MASSVDKPAQPFQLGSLALQQFLDFRVFAVQRLGFAVEGFFTTFDLRLAPVEVFLLLQQPPFQTLQLLAAFSYFLLRLLAQPNRFFFDLHQRFADFGLRVAPGLLDDAGRLLLGGTDLGLSNRPAQRVSAGDADGYAREDVQKQHKRLLHLPSVVKVP